MEEGVRGFERPPPAGAAANTLANRLAVLQFHEANVIAEPHAALESAVGATRENVHHGGLADLYLRVLRAAPRLGLRSGTAPGVARYLDEGASTRRGERARIDSQDEYLRRVLQRAGAMEQFLVADTAFRVGDTGALLTDERVHLRALLRQLEGRGGAAAEAYATAVRARLAADNAQYRAVLGASYILAPHLLLALDQHSESRTLLVGDPRTPQQEARERLRRMAYQPADATQQAEMRSMSRVLPTVVEATLQFVHVFFIDPLKQVFELPSDPEAPLRLERQLTPEQTESARGAAMLVRALDGLVSELRTYCAVAVNQINRTNAAIATVALADRAERILKRRVQVMRAQPGRTRSWQQLLRNMASTFYHTMGGDRRRAIEQARDSIQQEILATLNALVQALLPDDDLLDGTLNNEQRQQAELTAPFGVVSALLKLLKEQDPQEQDKRLVSSNAPATAQKLGAAKTALQQAARDMTSAANTALEMAKDNFQRALYSESGATDDDRKAVMDALAPLMGSQVTAVVKQTGDGFATLAFEGELNTPVHDFARVFMSASVTQLLNQTFSNEDAELIVEALNQFADPNSVWQRIGIDQQQSVTLSARAREFLQKEFRQAGALTEAKRRRVRDMFTINEAFAPDEQAGLLIPVETAQMLALYREATLVDRDRKKFVLWKRVVNAASVVGGVLGLTGTLNVAASMGLTSAGVMSGETIGNGHAVKMLLINPYVDSPRMLSVLSGLNAGRFFGQMGMVYSASSSAGRQQRSYTRVGLALLDLAITYHVMQSNNWLMEGLATADYEEFLSGRISGTPGNTALYWQAIMALGHVYLAARASIRIGGVATQLVAAPLLNAFNTIMRTETAQQVAQVLQQQLRKYHIARPPASAQPSMMAQWFPSWAPFKRTAQSDEQVRLFQDAQQLYARFLEQKRQETLAGQSLLQRASRNLVESTATRLLAAATRGGISTARGAVYAGSLFNTVHSTVVDTMFLLNVARVLPSALSKLFSITLEYFTPTNTVSMPVQMAGEHAVYTFEQIRADRNVTRLRDAARQYVDAIRIFQQGVQNSDEAMQRQAREMAESATAEQQEILRESPAYSPVGSLVSMLGAQARVPLSNELIKQERLFEQAQFLDSQGHGVVRAYSVFDGQHVLNAPYVSLAQTRAITAQLTENVRVKLLGELMAAPDETEALVHALGEQARMHIDQTLYQTQMVANKEMFSVHLAGQSSYAGTTTVGDLLHRTTLAGNALAHLMNRQNELIAHALTTVLQMRMQGGARAVGQFDVPRGPAPLRAERVLAEMRLMPPGAEGDASDGMLPGPLAPLVNTTLSGRTARTVVTLLEAGAVQPGITTPQDVWQVPRYNDTSGGVLELVSDAGQGFVDGAALITAQAQAAVQQAVEGAQNYVQSAVSSVAGVFGFGAAESSSPVEQLASALQTDAGAMRRVMQGMSRDEQQAFQGLLDGYARTRALSPAQQRSALSDQLMQARQTQQSGLRATMRDSTTSPLGAVQQPVTETDAWAAVVKLWEHNLMSSPGGSPPTLERFADMARIIAENSNTVVLGWNAAQGDPDAQQLMQLLGVRTARNLQRGAGTSTFPAMSILRAAEYALLLSGGGGERGSTAGPKVTMTGVMYGMNHLLLPDRTAYTNWEVLLDAMDPLAYQRDPQLLDQFFSNPTTMRLVGRVFDDVERAAVSNGRSVDNFLQSLHSPVGDLLLRFMRMRDGGGGGSQTFRLTQATVLPPPPQPAPETPSVPQGAPKAPRERTADDDDDDTEALNAMNAVNEAAGTFWNEALSETRISQASKAVRERTRERLRKAPQAAWDMQSAENWFDAGGDMREFEEGRLKTPESKAALEKWMWTKFRLFTHQVMLPAMRRVQMRNGNGAANGLPNTGSSLLQALLDAQPDAYMQVLQQPWERDPTWRERVGFFPLQIDKQRVVEQARAALRSVEALQALYGSAVNSEALDLALREPSTDCERYQQWRVLEWLPRIGDAQAFAHQRAAGQLLDSVAGDADMYTYAPPGVLQALTASRAADLIIREADARAALADGKLHVSDFHVALPGETSVVRADLVLASAWRGLHVQALMALGDERATAYNGAGTWRYMFPIGVLDEVLRDQGGEHPLTKCLRRDVEAALRADRDAPLERLPTREDVVAAQKADNALAVSGAYGRLRVMRLRGRDQVDDTQAQTLLYVRMPLLWVERDDAKRHRAVFDLEVQHPVDIQLQGARAAGERMGHTLNQSDAYDLLSSRRTRA